MIHVMLMLLLVASALSPAQETQYSVSLSASPAECAAALIGAGLYREGMQATIEARPSAECRFSKWVFSGGGLPREVSANPFTFYVFGNIEAVAVFERLYRENGSVIPRLYVAFAANISSTLLNLPKPRIVRPGETVEFSVQREVLEGDMKYTFLYWEGPDGLRIDSPTSSLKVNKSITLVANFYAYRKFLDEYYPLYLFKRPVFPDVQLPDGRVQRAEAIRIMGYNVTLPIQRVPEPLLSLIEPVYYTYVPYILEADSPVPVSVKVNGKELVIASQIKLIDREGKTVVVEAPTAMKEAYMSAVSVGDRLLTPSSQEMETVVAKLEKPLYITLMYKLKGHAALLNIPIVGEALYSLAEAGYRILALLHPQPMTLPYPLALASPIAIFASAAAGSYIFARKTSASSLRAAVAGGVKTAAGLRRRIAPIIDRGPPAIQIIEVGNEPPASAVFKAPEPLAEMVDSVNLVNPVEEAEPDEEEAALAEEELETLAKVEELEKVAVERHRRITAPSSLLQLTRFDENLFNAVAEGYVKLEPDEKPAIYMREAKQLKRLASNIKVGLVTVAVGDQLLTRRAVEQALREAGRKAALIGNIVLPTSPDAAAAELKKLAKGADTVVIETRGSPWLAQAAASARLLIVALGKKGEITFPPIPSSKTPAIAASLLAEKNVLQRLDYSQFTELVNMAEMFRGSATVASFIELLEEGVPPEQALDSVWAIEFRQTFPGFEAEIAKKIVNGMSYGEARDLYVTAYRQVTSGGNPEAAWRNFLNKLQKLGVSLHAEAGA
ncbi:MAG: hypothetical protein QW074_06625 [Candidatus Caldarchaeum sp.]